MDIITPTCHAAFNASAKDWRIPPGSVYVGRCAKWGNPFLVGRHGSAAECVELSALTLFGYLCLAVDDGTFAAQKREEIGVGTKLGEEISVSSILGA